jgi:hypothetical protein
MPDILHTIGEVTIEAAAGDKPARISVLAYAGGLMSPPGFGETIVELSALETPGEIVLLADHANEINAVIGSGTPSKEGGMLLVSGTISLATPAGQTVLALAKDGVKLGASVGVEVLKREHIKAGSKVTINGRSHTAGDRGLTVVRGGILREVSITPIPADRNTAVTIAASKGAQRMATIENENEIRLSERQRLGEIEKLCAAPHGGWGAKSRRVDELRASALDGEISVDELRAGLLDVLRSSRPTVGAAANGNRPPENGVLEAALCLSSGMTEQFVGTQYDERTMNAAVAKPMRNLGIHAVLRSVLRAASMPVPDRFGPQEIKAAFEADRMLRASSFSTLSLPGILGNVANKSMLESYLGMNTTWNTFCGIAANSDFKTHTRYRMTASGAFEQVGKGGEIKHVTMTEEGYANKLDTYGAMITLTREDIINDDLSAFGKLPRLFGRQAAIALEKAVFTLLLSNPVGDDTFAFFSTDHLNFSTSAGVLDIDALTAMEQAFLELVDANGDPILITPSTLLVPPALSVTATLLTSSLEIRDTNASTKYTTENPHAKKFQVAVSPWLSNANLTGNSDTGYYLMARPSDIAAMEVAFLGGQQNPTIESGDTSFNTLGIQWRAYHDFGVAMQDWRAGVFYDGTT